MNNFRVIRNRKAHRRKLFARRFVTVSLILGLFVFAGYTMYNSRIERIKEATAQLEHYESRLADVMMRQGYYLNEIIRLGDEDYIAMLAREQHFLSMPNETVFIIGDLNVTPELGEENYEN